MKRIYTTPMIQLSTSSETLELNKDAPMSYKIEIDVTDTKNQLKRTVWYNAKGEPTEEEWIKNDYPVMTEDLPRRGFELKKD